MDFLSASALLRFFQIQADGSAAYRQAKTIQIFVITLSIAAMIQTAIGFFIYPASLGTSSISLMVIVFIWTLICLRLLRNGRLLPAVHSYFIVFNAFCFLLPLLNENAHSLHYLALASIVAVALVHTIRISVGYTVALITLATISSLSAGQPTLSGLATYIVTALGVSIISWLIISGNWQANETGETAVSSPTTLQSPQNPERVAELSALYQLSNHLSLAPTLTAIFEGSRQEIMTLVEATGMSVSLVTPDGRQLNWIYGYENGQEVDLTAVPLLSIDEGFSGYVARSREVLHIADQIDERYEELRSRIVGEEFGAWLGLPMIVANKVIGVLAVENDAPFSKRAIELLTSAANSIAIAIHNLIQLEAVQTALAAQSEQRILLQAAAEVSAATTSILDINTLMQEAVDLIKARFVMYYVGLFLIDPQTNTAVLKAGTGDAGNMQLQQNFHLPVGERSLIGGATADGQPRIIQDVSTSNEWLPNPHLPQTRSESVLPLRVRGHISGALTIQSAEPNAFKPELISALQTMGDQLAIAIENAQLLARAESRVKRQQMLNQISGQMYRTIDVDEIVRLGLQSLSELHNHVPVNLTLGQQTRNQGED